jgi:hypothetical protein
VKGLIVDEPWIGLILSGLKTWEMRKTKCRHRGPIALIRKGSGQVVGTAELADSLPAINDKNEYARAEAHHRIAPNRQLAALDAGWRVPWVLRNVQLLTVPIAYAHPSGAVIWVNLDNDVKNAIDVQSGFRVEQHVHAIDHPRRDRGISSPATPLPLQQNEFGIRTMKKEIHFVVQRGKAANTILYPHLHADGCYVVSPSRFEKDYIRVRSIDEVEIYLGRGYSLRMSNQDSANHRAPSLIAPGSIKGWQ